MRPLILLPTLNEEAGLPRTVATIRRALPRSPIMVVDGNSTDSTRAIARRLRCRVLVQKGKGKGNALIEALHRIPPKTVVALLDADSSYDARDVRAFVRQFQGDELIIGNRFARLQPGSLSAFNHAGNLVFNTLASVLFLHPLRDMLTGVRVFRCSTLRRLGLEAQNFEIETEMTLKALKAGVRVVELPCRYHPRAGTSKLHPIKDGARILRRILKERLS